VGDRDVSVSRTCSNIAVGVKKSLILFSYQRNIITKLSLSHTAKINQNSRCFFFVSNRNALLYKYEIMLFEYETSYTCYLRTASFHIASRDVIF